MRQRRPKGFTLVLAIIFLGLITMSMAMLTTQNGKAWRWTRNLETRAALRNLSFSVGCLLRDDQRLIHLASQQQGGAHEIDNINWPALEPNGLVVEIDPNMPGISSGVTLTFLPADNQTCLVKAAIVCGDHSFCHSRQLNRTLLLPEKKPTPAMSPLP